MAASKKTAGHARRHPGAKSPAPHHYKVRCEEGAERQTAYGALSTQEKIDLLDRKLGKGLGAVRQRVRLAGKPVAKTQSDPVVVEAVAKPVKTRAKDRRAAESNQNG